MHKDSKTNSFTSGCTTMKNDNLTNHEKVKVIEISVYHIISLTLSQTSPSFTCLQYKPFENTAGKGDIARNEQFLLFPQCFLPI